MNHREIINELRQACREQGTPRIQTAIDAAEVCFDCLSPNAAAEIATLRADLAAAEARESNLKRLLRETCEWNWIDWEEEKESEPDHGNIAAGCFTALERLESEIDAALSEKGGE